MKKGFKKQRRLNRNRALIPSRKGMFSLFLAVVILAGTLQLTACDVKLLFDSINQIVDSNSVQALFSGENDDSGERIGEVPFTVTFTDESVGNIEAWEWDFDSDGNVDSTEQNPEWEYTNPGLYDVTLRVHVGSYIDTIIRTEYIEVLGELVADFSATPLAGTDSLTVDFTDESTGDITEWEWDFDEDGTVDSTEQNPSHTFNEGLYDISLTVKNEVISAEATEVKSAYIRVWDGAVADYSVSPSTYELTNATDTVIVTFTNLSQGTSPNTIWISMMQLRTSSPRPIGPPMIIHTQKGSINRS
jgi:hypothetical protein